MSDSTMSTGMTTGLVSTWVRTVDARGRAHLETRWVDAAASAPSPASGAVAASAARPLASHGHAA